MIEYSPIGFFESSYKTAVQAPRQGSLRQSPGRIVFNKELSEHCWRDLEGFERIWVIFDFHHNKTWTPTVHPPRGSDRRRGVFSTRSPYRPNAIGLSCVRLLQVEARSLLVAEHDLLDGTPILDVKPYIVYADSFPEASQGWLGPHKAYTILEQDILQEKLDWLLQKGNLDLRDPIYQVLSLSPQGGKAHRIRVLSENTYEFAYKTWRVQYTLDQEEVTLQDCSSGYSPEELAQMSDSYQDKDLHRQFIEKFKVY